MESLKERSLTQKSCFTCTHVKTCAAYRAFAGALEQLKVNYEFIEQAPFPAESLARVCLEYTQSKIFKIKQIQTSTKQL